MQGMLPHPCLGCGPAGPAGLFSGHRRGLAHTGPAATCKQDAVAGRTERGNMGVSGWKGVPL